MPDEHGITDGKAFHDALQGIIRLIFILLEPRKGLPFYGLNQVAHLFIISISFSGFHRRLDTAPEKAIIIGMLTNIMKQNS